MLTMAASPSTLGYHVSTQADQCLLKPFLFWVCALGLHLTPNLLQLSIRALNLALMKHFLLSQSPQPGMCASRLTALGIPECSLCLTSSTCHGAGEEVSLPPLMADGLVKEELDHAAFGHGVPGLDRKNGDGMAHSTH